MSVRTALVFLLEKALKSLRTPPTAPAVGAPKGAYGLSFDDSVTLAELPILNEFKANMFCIPNKQVGVIEILSIDEVNKTMQIREICTDNEYAIGIDVFNFLFVERPPIPLDKMF